MQFFWNRRIRIIVSKNLYDIFENNVSSSVIKLEKKGADSFEDELLCNCQLMKNPIPKIRFKQTYL